MITQWKKDRRLENGSKRPSKRIKMKVKFFLESKRQPKKRDALGKSCQALITEHSKNKDNDKRIISNSKQIRIEAPTKGIITNSKSIKKQNKGLISIWYTNADTLTKEKLCELKEEINTSTPLDVIAIRGKTKKLC